MRGKYCHTANKKSRVMAAIICAYIKKPQMTAAFEKNQSRRFFFTDSE